MWRYILDNLYIKKLLSFIKYIDKHLMFVSLRVSPRVHDERLVIKQLKLPHQKELYSLHLNLPLLTQKIEISVQMTPSFKLLREFWKNYTSKNELSNNALKRDNQIYNRAKEFIRKQSHHVSFLNFHGNFSNYFP